MRLDRDESEWRFILIDDPEVIQLIRNGRPKTDPVVPAVNFNRSSLAYSSNFEKLYQCGVYEGLHLGSGLPFVFSAYSWRFFSVFEGVHSGRGGGWEGVATENSAAVATLFETRTVRLAKHKEALEHYLHRESPQQNK